MRVTGRDYLQNVKIILKKRRKFQMLIKINVFESAFSIKDVND
jgi:hypothetical protein